MRLVQLSQLPHNAPFLCRHEWVHHKSHAYQRFVGPSTLSVPQYLSWRYVKKQARRCVAAISATVDGCWIMYGDSRRGPIDGVCVWWCLEVVIFWQGMIGWHGQPRASRWFDTCSCSGPRQSRSGHDSPCGRHTPATRPLKARQSS